MSVRLLLVRHGQAASNRELRYLGRSDEALTVWGLEQAEALGRQLEGTAVEAVLSSPLRRARDTAVAIAAAQRLEVEVMDDLTELCFGEWEGMTREEVLASGAEAATWLKRWERDGSVRPPAGESRHDLGRRMDGVLDEVARRYPGRTVALVTHVGPIKSVLARVLGVEGLLPMFLDPGTVTVVDWSDRPVIRLFNAHGHFGWLKARWMESPYGAIEPSASGR